MAGIRAISMPGNSEIKFAEKRKIIFNEDADFTH
jgi:hypothetical protein